MVSKMAMEDCASLIQEGCTVRPEDVVKLNALGLRIEKTPDFRLASMPRIAVLKGVIFRQPTIEQDMFIDDAYKVMSQDPATVLALEAYVLAHPDKKFDKIRHPMWFAAKCSVWMRSKLGSCTADEVRRAVDFCLYGVD